MTVWDYLDHLTCMLAGPQFGNRVILIILIIIAVLTVIQLSRIPWKPWSAIARGLGKALNAEFLTEVKDLRGEISDLKTDLDKRDSTIHDQLDALEQHRAEDKRESKERDAKQNALTARYRLIRFADEIRQGVEHSQEHFEQMLEDKDLYEDYCKTHPKFPNSKATSSIRLVQDTYDRCLKENKFK